jgi:hypothetical protein
MILDAMYVHWSSMGGMIYFTWPLMGLPALLAVMAVAYLFGWRPARGLARSASRRRRIAARLP